MARIPGINHQDDGEFSEYVLSRPKLHPIALHGVLREMVDAACANTEAVPSTVAIHILARFAATLGRTAYIEIGDQQRYNRVIGVASRGAGSPPARGIAVRPS